jgi:hypothetical protein
MMMMMTTTIIVIESRDSDKAFPFIPYWEDFPKTNFNLCFEAELVRLLLWEYGDGGGNFYESKAHDRGRSQSKDNSNGSGDCIKRGYVWASLNQQQRTSSSWIYWRLHGFH